MSDQIINRVANSALQVIDLEELYQEGRRTLLSITAFLDDGIVLREQTFRQRLQSRDWNIYRDQFVALHCPDDVLVPQWATLLVVTHLQPMARYVVVGTAADLEQQLFTEQLALMDFTPYQDGLVIIKGCSNKPVPEQALGLLAAKLTPIVKKLSFGEACSSVPLYKKP